MISTKYYNCQLLSDVIINQSMATAEDVNSLDYLPGSTFLGIVAGQIYRENSAQNYAIFHQGKVKFGDATIASGHSISYQYPNCFFRDKLDPQGPFYLHHLITKENYPSNEQGKIQLKQLRRGYFSLEEKRELNIEKRFALKSARERATRTSKSGCMYAYESIEAGQDFIFPISYEDPSLIPIVEKALLGQRRVGKSKTAEYALVSITPLELKEVHQCISSPTDYTLVYAHSNLCFLDPFGQPTLHPSAQDLGLESGTIDWEKSQVRTYHYTSWNGKRRSPNTQRFCLSRGSVFYVANCKEKGCENYVGAYQAEGLGHVLVNPAFLFKVNESNPLTWGIKLQEKVEKANDFGSDRGGLERLKNTTLYTKLGRNLRAKKLAKHEEFHLAKDVMDHVKDSINNNAFPKITPSQWGNIRTAATTMDEDKMWEFLFATKMEEKDGVVKEIGCGALTGGVAFKRYWNKSNQLETFRTIITGKSCQFVAKFAAQMAKEEQKKQNINSENTSDYEN